MKRSNYIAGAEALFLKQLRTFTTVLPSYAALLEVSDKQLAVLTADAAYYAYALDCANFLARAAQEWNTWKLLLRRGGTASLDSAPKPPTLPATVPAVALGIEPRFRRLVQQIKKHPNYNAAIGEALGIEGAEVTAPDLTALQPVLELRVSGGRVVVDWGWQHYGRWLDMCELQVDRGDGKGFVTLTFDTTPGYTDLEPFPSTPTRWTYRAIYRVGDRRVGQWSKPVTVLVG